MGDISEMMLEGMLCQQCGVAMEENMFNPPGHPVSCCSCKREMKIQEKRRIEGDVNVAMGTIMGLVKSAHKHKKRRVKNND